MHRTLASGLACIAMAWFASPARAQCDLSTLYAWTTWAPENTVCYFDLDATRAVNITGLSINTGTQVGTPIAIEMYVRTGSYVGHTDSPLGWSLAAAGTGVAAALDTPSRSSFASPVLLGPGRHGIGVRYLNCTNLHTRGNGANQLYSGALYSLSLGGSSSLSPSTNTPMLPVGRGLSQRNQEQIRNSPNARPAGSTRGSDASSSIASVKILSMDQNQRQPRSSPIESGLFETRLVTRRALERFLGGTATLLLDR